MPDAQKQRRQLAVAANWIMVEYVVGGAGTVSSNLTESCNQEDADYVLAMETIERLVLAHACAGIEVADPRYVDGLVTVIDAVANAML